MGDRGIKVGSVCTDVVTQPLDLILLEKTDPSDIKLHFLLQSVWDPVMWWLHTGNLALSHQSRRQKALIFNTLISLNIKYLLILWLSNRESSKWLIDLVVNDSRQKELFLHKDKWLNSHSFSISSWQKIILFLKSILYLDHICVTKNENN